MGMTGDHTGSGDWRTRHADFPGWGVCGCRGRIVCTPNSHVLFSPSTPATAGQRLIPPASASLCASSRRRLLTPCCPALFCSCWLLPLPTCRTPSYHRLIVLSSPTQSDEHLEPAHQPRRPPGVPGGQGERPSHAGVGALRRRAGAAEHGGRWALQRALPEVAGADAAPGQQLRRRRARRGRRGRPSHGPGACPVQAADARLPEVVPGQELQPELCLGGRRGQRPAGPGAAAAARAAGGRDLRRGVGRAPDRAHRAQDAPAHGVREPHGRERRGHVPDRRLRHLLRHRRLARHRPQRQGPARGAPEPRGLHRPDRPRPRTPTSSLIDRTPDAVEHGAPSRHRATHYKPTAVLHP